MPNDPNKVDRDRGGRKKDVKEEPADPYRRNRESRDLNSSQQEEENRSARQRAVKKNPEDKTGE